MPNQIATPFLHPDSPIALADKVVLDRHKTDSDAMDTRIKALETAVTGANFTNEPYFVNGGALFTGTEAIGLADFIHIRDSDGKIELASDTDQSKPADGLVLTPISAGGTVKILGTGGRVSAADLGLTNVTWGQQIFLGSGGSPTYSTTGTSRREQLIGVYRNSYFYLSFNDKGYWIA